MECTASKGHTHFQILTYSVSSYPMMVLYIMSQKMKRDALKQYHKEGRSEGMLKRKKNAMENKESLGDSEQEAMYLINHAMSHLGATLYTGGILISKPCYLNVTKPLETLFAVVEREYQVYQ